MTPLRITVVILALVILVSSIVAMFRVQWKLEAARRSDAPPMPSYNWGKFRHLTNPANLQPGSEPLAGRYRRLWYGTMLQPLGWIALIPWLISA